MINFKSLVHFLPFAVQQVLTQRVILHLKGTKLLLEG